MLGKMAANKEKQVLDAETEIMKLLDSFTADELLETLNVGKNIIKIIVHIPKKYSNDEKFFTRLQVLEDIKINLQKLKCEDHTEGMGNVTERLRRAVEILKGYEDDMDELKQTVHNEFLPSLANTKKPKKKEHLLEQLGGYEAVVIFVQDWLKKVAISVIYLGKEANGEEKAVQKLLKNEIVASKDRVVTKGDELVANLKTIRVA